MRLLKYGDTGNMIINCHVNEALHHINQAGYGAHYIIIYPDLDTLRELYSNYAGKQIQDNDEVVLINPFYETADSVRQVLSHNNYSMNVSRYEKENMLLIADSLKEYLGDQPHTHFRKSLANCAEMGKNGLSVLADLGASPHKSMYDDLVDYELSLPRTYDDVALKCFCLYHQKVFEKFSDEQKQKLVKHHGKTIKIIQAQ
jgi:hypothetical protein